VDENDPTIMKKRTDRQAKKEAEDKLKVEGKEPDAKMDDPKAQKKADKNARKEHKKAASKDGQSEDQVLASKDGAKTEDKSTKQGIKNEGKSHV
jgi:hypothetical protein